MTARIWTHEIEAPGPMALGIEHRIVGRAIPAPVRPFSFWITRGAEAVRVEWLRLGADEVIAGVPGSLLAPRAGDRLETLARGPSNLGDAPALMPGHLIELCVRPLAPVAVVSGLLVGILYTPRPSSEDLERERQRRRARRVEELAASFFAALITGAERDRKTAADHKPGRDLAFELARAHVEELERLERADEAPAELEPPTLELELERARSKGSR